MADKTLCTESQNDSIQDKEIPGPDNMAIAMIRKRITSLPDNRQGGFFLLGGFGEGIQS